MNHDASRRQLNAQTGDPLLMAAVKAVGDPEKGGELFDPETFCGRKRGESFMLERRHAFAMVSGRLGHEHDPDRAELFPRVFLDQTGRFTVMPFASRAGAPTDVMKGRRRLQQQSLGIPQAVEILQFIEKMHGQTGDVLDMMRFRLARVHEGEEFLAGCFLVHRPSKRAPKRRPRVLTYNSPRLKWRITAS